MKRYSALRSYSLVPITSDQWPLFCDANGRPVVWLDFGAKEPLIAKIVKKVSGGHRARYFIPESLEDMQHLYDFAHARGRVLEWYWGDSSSNFNCRATEGLGGRNVHLWPPGHHPREER